MGATVGLGHKSSLQLAKEGTYGTAPAAATAKIELITADFNFNIAVATDPSMNATKLSPRFIEQVSQFPSGTFKVRLGYTGYEELFRMCWPNYASSAVGTDRSHVFNEGSGGVLNSYTLEFSMGDIPTGKVTRITGCFVTGWRIVGQAQAGDAAMLTMEIDWVGKTATENQTPMTAASYPANAYGVVFKHMLLTAGNIADGSSNTLADIRLTSFNMSVSIPHKTDRLYFGGSNADYPVRSGYMDAKVSWEEEWNDVTLMSNARANALGALKFTFNNGIVIPASSPTQNYQMQIVASAPCNSEYGKSIPGFDSVMQKAAAALQNNATDVGCCKITIHNDVAALA